MTQLKEMLVPENVIYNSTISSKKKTLEMLAKAVSMQDISLDEQDIFEQFLQRERIGSTGFGNGVAIPHCRIEGCSKPVCVLLCLATAIDFDAMDEEKVDIFVGLVVPPENTDEHLQLLKQVVEVLQDADSRAKLREADNSQTLYHNVQAVFT